MAKKGKAQVAMANNPPFELASSAGILPPPIAGDTKLLYSILVFIAHLVRSHCSNPVYLSGCSLYIHEDLLRAEYYLRLSSLSITMHLLLIKILDENYVSHFHSSTASSMRELAEKNCVRLNFSVFHVLQCMHVHVVDPIKDPHVEVGGLPTTLSREQIWMLCMAICFLMIVEASLLDYVEAAFCLPLEPDGH